MRLPALGPRGEGWVALQIVLLPLVALSGVVTGGSLQGPLASLAVLTGVALMTGGAVLLGKGLLDLGRNLTPVPRPRADAQLVETGIYSLVRHPIYGGIILTAFGWALVATSLLTLLLALLLAAFFDLKSRREEVWLSDHYVGYRTYITRTRRFIPRVY
jgi:protein-S-isoprenylcysteine O-methyltransferase Ste14